VFRLTAAQLKARAGQVRCGRCQHVFQAGQHLVEKPAKPAAKAPAAPRKRSSRKTAKPGTAAAETAVLAPAATEPVAPVPAPATADLFTTPEPLRRPAPANTRTVYWSIGAVLLVLLLAGQAIVYYGQDLVRRAPYLHGAITVLCEVLPCQRLAPVDMRRLDLVETQITPHPRYDRVLRIKATIVNRAERAQPYPLLEVTLMDSQGHVVARRSYRPREYLGKPEQAAAGLPPQLAVNVQLDITSPGPRASGFEVLLLPPSE
jgi:predicted Zn finger-like uncharacterized protein